MALLGCHGINRSRLAYASIGLKNPVMPNGFRLSVLVWNKEHAPPDPRQTFKLDLYSRFPCRFELSLTCRQSIKGVFRAKKAAKIS